MEARSATRTGGLAAKDVTAGDQLDPQRTVGFSYEVAVALRSASRLICSGPDAVMVKPGSSKITQEPSSSSDTLRFTFGRSTARPDLIALLKMLLKCGASHG
jgi:hypothetical protein